MMQNSDHFEIQASLENPRMASQNAAATGKLFMYLAVFVFLCAESQALLVVHRGQHPFAFPSFLSSYWLPVVAIIPGIAGFMGIRSINRVPTTKLDPITRLAIVNWFSFGVMSAYALFGYTMNTIQVMTAHW